MSKQTNTKKPNRSQYPALLADKFMKDYDMAAKEFPDNKRTELTDHLLECLEIIEEFYANNEDKKLWKKYAGNEEHFIKKHGKRLKIYRQKNFHYYYSIEHALVEKDVISSGQFNSLPSNEQGLSIKEMEKFVSIIRNRLNLDKEFTLLRQIPEDEAEEKLAGTETSKTLKKGKLKREAQDKLTCLSQEQTVLLMYYLQQERVFLKDEYLTDMDAGKAFEILTGYSQHTLRQNLSKFNLYQNKANLKELDNLLTRLKIAIEKDLKAK